MPLVSDPRTYSFARIPNASCLIIANSSVAWSQSTCETYAAAKGIPLGNIVSYALGASDTWSVGSTPEIQTQSILAFCEWVRAQYINGGYRAILIGPGAPCRVAVLGNQPNLGSYDPLQYGYPPFSHLVAGAVSFVDELMRQATLVPEAKQYVASYEPGSARYMWAKVNYKAGAIVPNTQAYRMWGPQGATDSYSLAYNLGLTSVRDTSNVYNLETRSLTSHASASANATLPSGAASQFYGNPQSRWVPVGRIGWTAWTNLTVAESAAAIQDIIDSSDAAEAHVSQPAPIFAMLQNITGTDIVDYAGFANTAASWGYDVDHCYRVSSPNATAQGLRSTASAAFAWDAISNGAVTDYGVYMLLGAGLTVPNEDDPQTSGADGYSTFLPEVGATVADIGPSAGFAWGIRALTRGAAEANMDVTHRFASEHATGWIGAYKRLTGANGLELQPLGPTFCGCPSGDPLHRPFHFDPAGTLSLISPPPRLAVSYGTR
jgi:hypothetical protein